jgi:hypothetical protein
MNNEELRQASDDELINYFTKPKWGKIYEDDKYLLMMF